MHFSLLFFLFFSCGLKKPPISQNTLPSVLEDYFNVKKESPEKKKKDEEKKK